MRRFGRHLVSTRRTPLLVLCLVMLQVLSARPAGAQEVSNVDLELMLAVDVSSSVNLEEFELQMRGLSDAFRHPAVLAAIQSTGRTGIAVSVMQWSDEFKQTVVVDWMPVHDERSVLTLARRIRNAPRAISGGQTAISGALRFALEEIALNRFNGRRKVIDLSGDGRANAGIHPMPFRDSAVLQGVTVNGLAILNEEPFVDSYYRYSVIGGTGAFLMTATDYEDFAQAILEKLIKEIDVPFAERPPATVHAARIE